MVILTIRLTPPLTGVVGELWVIQPVSGEPVFASPIWNTSIDGVIVSQIFGAITGFDYFARFPAQVVEGFSIYETNSNIFRLEQDVAIDVALNSDTPPPPPPIPPTKASMGILALIALIGLIIFRKPNKK